MSCMSKPFELDPKKGALENIEDFLSHIEAMNTALGQALRKHIDKVLPLPLDPLKRSAARASFNSEIKKLLDAALAALKAKDA